MFDTATGTITSYSGAGGDIAIPATIGGVTVTGIGNNAFFGKTALTSLTIPNSVTSIGTSAFRGCTGLTSLTIPDGVTTIDSGVFADCTGLTKAGRAPSKA